jgi:hypothetical protein
VLTKKTKLDVEKIKLDVDRKTKLDVEKKNKKRKGIREHRTAANPPQTPPHKPKRSGADVSAHVLGNPKKPRSPIKRKEEFKNKSQEIKYKTVLL